MKGFIPKKPMSEEKSSQLSKNEFAKLKIISTQRSFAGCESFTARSARVSVNVSRVQHCFLLV